MMGSALPPQLVDFHRNLLAHALGFYVEFNRRFFVMTWGTAMYAYVIDALRASAVLGTTACLGAFHGIGPRQPSNGGGEILLRTGNSAGAATCVFS